MKKIISLVFLLLLIQGSISCAILETTSTPKHYNIILIDSKINRTKLFIHRGAGAYDEILPTGKIYSVNIAAMEGGYSSFLGIKFNKHTPEEYKVLKIMNGDKIVKEISIIEIEQSTKDDKGNYLIASG